MSFSKEFYWGAATAAYQIEGAIDEDGKGLSVWDIMCRKENAIFNHQTGNVACDHYHRWREDVALMQQIGLRAYRLSLSWPRILPEGVGRVNEQGLAFYDQLIDALLEAGITPFVTLFHWDFPYDLYCQGGWLNPAGPDWFAEYTRVVVERLSDRVTRWMTLNEPQCIAQLGHRDGYQAPGDKRDWAEVLMVVHRLLLAHGKSVQTIRAYAKTAPQIGFAPVGVVRIPATNSPEDIAAARTSMFSITDKHLWNNTWFTEPIFSKTYPDDGFKVFGRAVPQIAADDMDIIGQPIDFFGCNIYRGEIVRAGANGPEFVSAVDGEPLTLLRWPVTPDALYWGPRFFHERYGKPIAITENGVSLPDWVCLDGKVHDPQRIDYLARHLSALKRAVDEGIDVLGYFHWTLMDNFEWAEGYRQRFGLIYTDYTTQQRILKDSAYWYRDVIACDGASL
jgi:beta-glucosidase